MDNILKSTVRSEMQHYISSTVCGNENSVGA